MERTAITPPKPCFALEQHDSNPMCPVCPHKKECAELMDPLDHKVDVDQVRFHFMPPVFVEKLVRNDTEDPDFGRLETVYAFCYEWVFEEKNKSNVDAHKNVILQRVIEAKTSVKMFLLANMLGHQQSHHDAEFYPQMLTSDFAVKQVQTYAATCYNRFGVFDTTALDRLMGSNIAHLDFEAHLLNSEIIFGSWIVNYKLFHEGHLMENFYREKELAMNPYWLAIEPSYVDIVLRPHQRNPKECPSDLLKRHRSSAAKMRKRLRTATQKAIAVFGSREHIMPEAIRFVLDQRGLRPEHFQIDNVPVLEAAKFWSRLGSAIQQYECLKFVDKLPSIFDRHFVRTNSVLS